MADGVNHKVLRVDGNGNITTYAGTGEAGYAGDGGLATEAQLGFPAGVAVDASGNVYVADLAGHRIRRISHSGTITTFAGSGSYGYGGDEGPATDAELAFPAGVALDAAGDLYIADTGNRRVRVVRTRSFTIPREDTNSVGMEFVPVPAGEFQMGSTSGLADRDESPVTQVTISKAFHLGKHEVTQGQWEAVMGYNPSEFSECGADCPVESVSWDEAQDFIQTLNWLEGEEKYRLPTEAEWEYAARSGTDTDTHAGDLTNPVGADAALDGIAWYTQNSGQQTHSVGLKTPNGFGLHDMLGNVWEWVGDSYHPYRGGSVADPRRDPRFGYRGPNRVVRGGGWYYDARHCRSANRSNAGPAFRNVDVGFRVLLTPAVPQVSTNIHTFAGTGEWPHGGDGGPAIDAQIAPDSVAADADGRIYVVDGANHRIRRIDATGVITTFAGTGEAGFAGDGGPATEARLSFPQGVAVDGAGNVYVADTGNHRIRMIDASGTITTVAGTGVFGYGGDSGLAIEAQLSFPSGVAVDASGDVYVADAGNGRVRVIRTRRRYILPEETNSIGMEFVLVPAGEFQLGSTSPEAGSDERPVTQVRISAAFWIGKHEVTRGQWEAVMGSNPSYFDECGSDCPVERVSWDDVQEFVQKLNEREGGERYRLPTEAEWEYAARAGTTGDRYAAILDLIAWYSGNSGNRTHLVGQKAPNAFGLHDMLGNVWEWVQDWYGGYPGGSVTDPRGPGSGSDRVIRGGSWLYGARYCRASFRYYNTPGGRTGGLGFRLLRTK